MEVKKIFSEVQIEFCGSVFEVRIDYTQKEFTILLTKQSKQQTRLSFLPDPADKDVKHALVSSIQGRFGRSLRLKSYNV